MPNDRHLQELLLPRLQQLPSGQGALQFPPDRGPFGRTPGTVMPLAGNFVEERTAPTETFDQRADRLMAGAVGNRPKYTVASGEDLKAKAAEIDAQIASLQKTKAEISARLAALSSPSTEGVKKVVTRGRPGPVLLNGSEPTGRGGPALLTGAEPTGVTGAPSLIDGREDLDALRQRIRARDAELRRGPVLITE